MTAVHEFKESRTLILDVMAALFLFFGGGMFALNIWAQADIGWNLSIGRWASFFTTPLIIFTPIIMMQIRKHLVFAKDGIYLKQVLFGFKLRQAFIPWTKVLKFQSRDMPSSKKAFLYVHTTQEDRRLGMWSKDKELPAIENVIEAYSECYDELDRPELREEKGLLEIRSTLLTSKLSLEVSFLSFFVLANILCMYLAHVKLIPGLAPWILILSVYVINSSGNWLKNKGYFKSEVEWDDREIVLRSYFLGLRFKEIYSRQDLEELEIIEDDQRRWLQFKGCKFSFALSICHGEAEAIAMIFNHNRV